jgi:nicotinamide-nucleotide amidase
MADDRAVRGQPLTAQVVAVGDELLLGSIVNGNAALLGRELTAMGLRVTRAVAVGDDIAAIRDAVADAAGAADVVVVTGGLGPTSDDVTRDALAALLGTSLRRDPRTLERLAQWYADRGRPLVETAKRQADVPDGATQLENMRGTAPGLRVELGLTRIFALPGVPHELGEMLHRQVLPELSTGGVILLRVLHTAVAGEAAVAARLGPVEDALPAGVQLGYLASPGQVQVRLLCSAADPGAAESILRRVAERIRALLGSVFVGVDDDDLGQVVHRVLRERAETVAVAESLTGGLVGAELTSRPGASDHFRGGVLAYATDVKAGSLDVDPALLAAEGAVHPEVAAQMARGVARRLGSTYGVATTGVAGPDPQDGRAVGEVHLAVSGPAGTVVSSPKLTGDRHQIRRLAVVHAVDVLRRVLLDLPGYDDGELL